jgi:MoxR-like ATPase
MQERQVTVDERTHPLPEPFFVIATQNPVELEGTFPLPEAQLDRFLVLLNVGYPSAEDEDAMLELHGPAMVSVDSLGALFGGDALRDLAAQVRAVRVGEAVRQYIVDLIRGTRSAEGVQLGASPRAALALYRTVQARAAIRGRDHALPDDVKAQAEPALRHRLFLDADSEMRGRRPETVVAEVLARTPVPAEEQPGVAAASGR